MLTCFSLRAPSGRGLFTMTSTKRKRERRSRWRWWTHAKWRWKSEQVKLIIVIFSFALLALLCRFFLWQSFYFFSHRIHDMFLAPARSHPQSVAAGVILCFFRCFIRLIHLAINVRRRISLELLGGIRRWLSWIEWFSGQAKIYFNQFHAQFQPAIAASGFCQFIFSTLFER